MMKSAGKEQIPGEKGFFAVLSSRLEFRKARRVDSRQAVSCLIATNYAVLLMFPAGSNKGHQVRASW